MPSIAGRNALVKASGTPTSFTDEAVTVLTTNKKYQITSTSKRVWSPTATITVKAGGVAVDPVADPYVINRLTGTITFTNTSARGTVTVSGTYLPMTTVAKVKGYTATITSASLDDTTFDSNGWTERIAGINDITGTLNRNWESVGGTYFTTALVAGSVLVIQMFSNKNAAADLLVWARIIGNSGKAATTSIVESDVQFVGVADADRRVVSIA